MAHELVCGRWRLTQLLGRGAFGRVYVAHDATETVADGTQPFVMKLVQAPDADIIRESENENESGRRLLLFDRTDAPSDKPPQRPPKTLEVERNVYHVLHGVAGVPYVPPAFFVSQCRLSDDGKRYWYLVIEQLGVDLSTLQLRRAAAPKRFPPGAVCAVGAQVLHVLRAMHRHGYIHADLKPENLALGRSGSGQEGQTFVFDFGLAVRFRQRRKTRWDGLGTFLFSSRAADGLPDAYGLHPQNDLESLAYVLVYLSQGFLPWQGVPGTAQMIQVKAQPDVQQQLLRGRRVPDAVKQFTAFVTSFAHIDRTRPDIPARTYDALARLLWADADPNELVALQRQYAPHDTAIPDVRTNVSASASDVCAPPLRVESSAQMLRNFTRLLRGTTGARTAA